MSASTQVDPIICHCLKVTASQISQAVALGTVSCLRSAMEVTGAGKGCTACQRAVRALVEAECSQCPSSSSPTWVTR